MPIKTALINPDKKPLSELKIKNNDGFVSALNNIWIERQCFASYLSLVTSSGQLKSTIELEQWQQEAQWLKEDFEYLLTRQHHVFWSYMVHCKKALSSIVQFLQRATPFYIDISSFPSHIIEKYEQLLVLVLRILCRIITNKESAEAWITKEHLRQLIYGNFLISVPMLFDLLVAVGDANGQNASILSKIFETLLQIEPNYKQDLLAALAYFPAAFRSIQTQTENEGCEGAGGGIDLDNLENPYDDVARYCLDCAYSLSVLLEVCPLARALANELRLGQSIAHFYDSTIPFLFKNIFLINDAASSLSFINQARLQFLRAFRSISYYFVETVLQNPHNSLNASESYVGLLTECLSEQTFVIDFQRAYPLELDVEILRQACKDLDDFKANFVVKGYQKEAEAEMLSTIGSKALIGTQPFTVVNSPQSKSEATTNGEVPNLDRPQKTSISNRDIDLEVTAVLDVLPHLGTGFIRRILARYETSEDAIAAILEENLPPDLLNADQNEAYIPSDPQDKLFEDTGIRHYNAFDGDAYDVMTQEKPDCIIKQGKGFPNAPKNVTQLLDDKSDLNAIRHRYQQYTLVEEGGGDSDNQDEYEDEYDDSYEALLESETRVIKSKELKAGLANIQDISEDESDEEDGEQEATVHQNQSKNFCENPEVIRARYEAQRQAKWRNRGGGARPQAQETSRDVVGAPKGQGQDKETLRNRSKKEANKSSRANHNRKSQASFKRSKGMMS